MKELRDNELRILASSDEKLPGAHTPAPRSLPHNG